MTDIIGYGQMGNATISLYGAGPNAPDWATKTVYTAETFSVDLPTNSPNAAGFRGFQGFSGEFTNVTYPTVDTPFSTKRVLRITYPGQTETISTLDAATTAWPFKGTEYSNAAARVTGTWVGTLAFEKSTDGGSSWVGMTVRNIDSGLDVTQTTVNGTFRANTGTTTELFRVRASAWTSGTATVSVGMAGGQAAARFTAGAFDPSHGEIYTRIVVRWSSNFDNNGNTGQKFFFFRQVDGDNHYVNGNAASTGDTFRPAITLQPARTPSAAPTFDGARGVWHDLEFIATANTPGTGNGVGRTYLNGTLCAERTDFSFFDTGDIPDFYSFFCDPTYGGGINPPPANIYFEIAYWYRESRIPEHAVFSEDFESYADIAAAIAGPWDGDLVGANGGTHAITTFGGSKRYACTWQNNEASSSLIYKLPGVVFGDDSTGYSYVKVEWDEYRDAAWEFRADKTLRINGNLANQNVTLDMILGMGGDAPSYDCNRTALFGQGLGNDLNFILITNYTFNRETWYRLGVEIQLNTVGLSDGWAKVWRDGVVVGSVTGQNFRDNPPASGNTYTFMQVRIGGWESGGASPAPKTRYIDNVNIVATRNR